MNNILSMLPQFMNNPMALLGQYNVPRDIINNPMAIVQFLMNQGKISQGQYDAAVKQARSMGIKI